LKHFDRWMFGSFETCNHALDVSHAVALVVTLTLLLLPVDGFTPAGIGQSVFMGRDSSGLSQLAGGFQWSP